MKKVLVIYNPVAGSKKLSDAKKIIENILKKEGYDYDLHQTSKSEKNPFDRYLNNKYERIIVSGGDGTVSEVTSFIIYNNIKVPLIILPRGSANILALSIKIPFNIRKSLLNGLKNKGRSLDAMMVNNKRYGMIATGCGYDTLIMRQTTRSLKRKMGLLAYFWTVLKTIFIYRGKSYRLCIDGKRMNVVAKTIMIFNILPLSNLNITEQIIGDKILANDGILNIFVLNPRPIRDFLKFKKSIKVFKGKEISIKSRRESRFQIDGNVFKGKSVSIKVIPKAINIVY